MNNIFVAGHKGMVGSAILRVLKKANADNLFYASRNELNLTDTGNVRDFLKQNEITQIYIAAAKVGGIYANDNFPGDFINENLMIQNNLISIAFELKIKKILFLGSSCIYPKLSPQPIKEEYLLTSALEKTNEAYAVAKISGLKLCEYLTKQYNKEFDIDYRSLMPTNLYGQGDNYHELNSHVVPALIRKFHEAKVKDLANVEVWGTGLAKREFLYVDDLADAAVFAMNASFEDFYNKNSFAYSHINVGSDEEVSIKELANLIKKVTGYSGKITFNDKFPDGTPRKLLDSSKIKSLGWKPKLCLQEGLELTYNYFKELNL